jgi:hypothetical protein
MPTKLPSYNPDLLNFGNKLVDFGPPLAYPLICSAYTVEKLTLWHRTTDDLFETIAIKAPHMPRARIEGHLYRLTDEEFKKLDIRRQLGVQYERKRLPVYVPFLDENGNLQRIYAEVYLGLKQNWVPKIEFDAQFKENKQEFKLADKYPDAHRVLHNRYCTLPPLQEATTTRFTPDVIRHVRRKNNAAVRWGKFRRWMSNFVNDE